MAVRSEPAVSVDFTSAPRLLLEWRAGVKLCARWSPSDVRAAAMTRCHSSSFVCASCVTGSYRSILSRSVARGRWPRTAPSSAVGRAHREQWGANSEAARGGMQQDAFETFRARGGGRRCWPTDAFANRRSKTGSTARGSLLSVFSAPIRPNARWQQRKWMAN